MLNGAEAISGFNPGEVVIGVSLPAGSYDVKIVGTGDDCDDAAILQAADLELASGESVTAIAYLSAEGAPTLGLFTNNVRALPKATARLQVRHAAEAPEVNVWANGAPLVTGLANGETATSRVPKGIYAAWGVAPRRLPARDRSGGPQAQGGSRVPGVRLGQSDGGLRVRGRRPRRRDQVAARGAAGSDGRRAGRALRLSSARDGRLDHRRDRRRGVRPHAPARESGPPRDDRLADRREGIGGRRNGPRDARRGCERRPARPTRTPRPATS